MFYKNLKDSNQWLFGSEVHFPDNEKLDFNNRQPRDGWKWHDEPPKGFVDWLAHRDSIVGFENS